MRPCGSFSSCAVRLWDFQGLLWIHRLRRLQSVANPSLLKVAANRKKVVALCAKDSTWHPSSIEQVGTWIRTHHPKKTSSWLRLGANMPKQKTKENIALSLHARLYHFKCACQTRWCFPWSRSLKFCLRAPGEICEPHEPHEPLFLFQAATASHDSWAIWIHWGLGQLPSKLHCFCWWMSWDLRRLARMRAKDIQTLERYLHIYNNLYIHIYISIYLINK